MKIAITGHRPNKLGNDYNLTSPLLMSIKETIMDVLISECENLKELTLISGMALGIDTLFANIAIENNIPFIASIPCQGQASVWSSETREKWNELLSKACQVVNVSGKILYEPYMMQKRNEWMVNNCDILIAVWDGTSGGTKNCIDYAISKNKRIVYVDIKDLGNIKIIREKSLFN